MLWADHLKQLPYFSDNAQLVFGDRFRPILVCWGYMVSMQRAIDLDEKKELAEIGIAVELLHKASVMLDDLVDQDIARRGNETFHVTHGQSNAIMFSVYLLSSALQMLSKSFIKHKVAKRISNKHYDLIFQTLAEMSTGALKEINNNHENQLLKLEEVREIINLETVSLIKNSFLLGFSLGSGSPDLERHMAKVGNCCGYIFQILNDFEPFWGEKKYNEYKGGNNWDINKSRKNIAFAFLMETFTPKDRNAITKTLFDNSVGQDDKYKMVKEKLIEYDVFNQLCEDIADMVSLVEQTLEKAKQEFTDPMLYLNFRVFIKKIFNKGIKRLDDESYARLVTIFTK